MKRSKNSVAVLKLMNMARRLKLTIVRSTLIVKDGHAEAEVLLKR